MEWSFSHRLGSILLPSSPLLGIPYCSSLEQKFAFCHTYTLPRPAHLSISTTFLPQPVTFSLLVHCTSVIPPLASIEIFIFSFLKLDDMISKSKDKSGIEIQCLQTLIIVNPIPIVTAYLVGY